MNGVRYPAVAGAFYPNDPEELRTMIGEFLRKAEAGLPSPTSMKGKLRGIIVPHAGYIYSAPVAAYAYKLLERFIDNIPEKFLLLGPSHYAFFPGLAESGYSSWNTPLGNLDTFTIRNKENSSLIHVIPAAHEPEHSLEVQLPLLQYVLSSHPDKKISIDPILTGDILPEAAASLLESLSEDVFFIISSDLSHYQPYTQALALDKETISLAEKLDLNNFIDKGDACGKCAISIAIALAKKKKWKVLPLHYANSGDTAGPKTEVVGYSAMAILG